MFKLALSTNIAGTIASLPTLSLNMELVTFKLLIGWLLTNSSLIAAATFPAMLFIKEQLSIVAVQLYNSSAPGLYVALLLMKLVFTILIVLAIKYAAPPLLPLLFSKLELEITKSRASSYAEYPTVIAPPQLFTIELVKLELLMTRLPFKYFAYIAPP